MRRADREVTNRPTLEAILNRADCCHLALVDGAEPYLVTLNFGFQWTGPLPTFYFHCAPTGRKIDILSRNPRACVTVDVGHELVTAPQACGYGMKYQSLVGFGEVSTVTDDAERRRGLDLLMGKFTNGGIFDYDARVLGQTRVLRLDLTELTGKIKA